MSDTESPPEEAQDALERLHDDPTAAVAALRESQPDDDAVDGAVSVFKALGNEDRLRVLAALRESECCGCELQAVLDAPQSTVATHVRKLKDAGLVRSRRKGKWTYYRIADSAALDLLDLAYAISEER